MRSYKTLIIGGHIRSGTTLLWRICNTHPDIKLTYEFNNFSALGKPYKKYIKSILHRVWLRGLFSYNVLNNNNSNLNLIQKIKKSVNNNVFIMKYLYNVIKRRTVVKSDHIGSYLHKIFNDKIIVGDKYPHYLFLLDKYPELENLLVLIVYRDCRDVVSSTLKKVRTDWKNQKWTYEYDTAEKVAKKWVESINIMESHRNNIHIVRYENLMNNSVDEISSIGEYLGVRFPSNLTDNVDTSSIGKYKTYLSEEEIQSIMRVAGPVLSRLEYI